MLYEMKDTLWTKDFIFLLIANALAYCSFQLLFPTLPVFLSEHGNNPKEVGIVMGIFTVSSVLIRPFIAQGSRKWGKKSFLNIGLVINLLAVCLYIFATTFSSALTIRIIHGFGFGITTTLFAVILADLTPSSRRGESIGYLAFGVVVTSSLAPFLGLWVFNDFGPALLFAVASLTIILSLFCVLFISNPVSYEDADSNHSNGIVRNLVVRNAIFPSLLVFLLGTSVGSILSFIALFGKENNISNIGWFFFSHVLGSFTARLIAGRIYDRKGHAFTIIPGAIMGIIGLLLLSQTSTTPQLIVSAVLYGLGSGSIIPTLQAWVLNRVHTNHRTEATAMFFNALDLGIAGGSIALGFLASVSSYSFMYFCSGVIMIGFLVIYISSLVRSKKYGNEF